MSLSKKCQYENLKDEFLFDTYDIHIFAASFDPVVGIPCVKAVHGIGRSPDWTLFLLYAGVSLWLSDSRCRLCVED